MIRVRKIEVSNDFWKFTKHESVDKEMNIPEVTQSILEEIRLWREKNRKGGQRASGFNF